MNPSPPDSSHLGNKRRLLLALERFSRRRYRLVFLMAAVLAALGIWLGPKLRLESDILALIPRGNPQVDTFKEAAETFGALSYLTVLVDAGEGTGADEVEDFGDALAARLGEQDELIESIEYRIDPGAGFLSLVYEKALLFLPPERLPELAKLLSDDGIARQIEQNRLSLNSPTAPLTEELIVADPLQLMPLFLNRLVGNRGLVQLDLSDGYYLTKDGRTLVLLVKPTEPWQKLEFSERLMIAVRDSVEKTREEFRDAGESEIAGLAVHFAGHYAMVVDEAHLIRQDIRFNILFSLGAVLVLYWICYRRFAALFYSSVPLLVGQALTFALAFVVLRSLNASSSAFTALLMGLGTDFVIVMYARYVEERRLGRGIAEATERMVGETGLGVFTGAITSAGTFYAMCISEFRGLRDLGFLIGTGILFCAVAILFLVPAMITWNEGARRRRVDVVPKLHVQSFFIERLIVFSARHRRPVLAVIAVLTVLGAVLALRLEFDDSVNVLRSDQSPAYLVEKSMQKRFGSAPSYMIAIAEARTQAEVLELTAQIETRLAPFVAQGIVASSESLLSYLPTPSQQQAVLAEVKADATRSFDPDRVEAAMVRALEENGFQPEPFAPSVERVREFLTPSGVIGLDDIERRGLSRLVERFVRRERERVRAVTYLYLTDPKWKRQPPPGLVETLSAGDPRIIVTGTNVVSREFRRIFSREAPRAVALGFLVVFVLLWIDFRSLRLTGIALAQLVVGVVFMLALMKISGIHLNYVNAFVTTMILGVGIDYGIHIIHRLSGSGGRIEPGLMETGKAVVIAALTNVAAFGTLTLGSYPALRSFGLVALFGSLTCLLTALTLVPALMVRSSDEGPVA